MLEPAGNRMTAARRTRSGGSTAAETGAQARLNTFPRPRAMTIGSSDGWSAPPACAVFGCTTCGTPLLRSCWPGREPHVVMEILGHSQISVTMNTYSHVTPASSREAVARVEGWLFEGHSEFE